MKVQPGEQSSGLRRYTQNTTVCTFFVLFFHPIYYLRHSVFSPTLVVTQIQNHKSRLFSRLPHYGYVPSFLSRERVQHFLPSSTCVEFCLPTRFKRSRQLVSFEKKTTVLATGIRTRDFNVSRLVFEVLPLDHRGDLQCKTQMAFQRYEVVLSVGGARQAGQFGPKR